ncbi:MAG: hypothetical protein E4H02_04100 [Lentisphaerales bacterium]|jgi:hypothetical protein|nr:MAG: hypothetical protein E4H02_04100 [Lentisphaerales bacterium]
MRGAETTGKWLDGHGSGGGQYLVYAYPPLQWNQVSLENPILLKARAAIVQAAYALREAPCCCEEVTVQLTCDPPPDSFGEGAIEFLKEKGLAPADWECGASWTIPEAQ